MLEIKYKREIWLGFGVIVFDLMFVFGYLKALFSIFGNNFMYRFCSNGVELFSYLFLIYLGINVMLGIYIFGRYLYRKCKNRNGEYTRVPSDDIENQGSSFVPELDLDLDHDLNMDQVLM